MILHCSRKLTARLPEVSAEPLQETEPAGQILEATDRHAGNCGPSVLAAVAVAQHHHCAKDRRSEGSRCCSPRRREAECDPEQTFNAGT